MVYYILLCSIKYYIILYYIILYIILHYIIYIYLYTSIYMGSQRSRWLERSFYSQLFMDGEAKEPMEHQMVREAHLQSGTRRRFKGKALHKRKDKQYT